ncbi:NAD(P)/FAD-dependent oxidoreductase [Fulvivirga sp. RKSG066]|uniref:ArsO family NAD(P)H-dependent flavin-containing monooxygenase n=1 Tax=Fulvivirga aurantia TaxID=2529383 RepID=UPI0012BD14D8|nr:ArsO family NAD(P)H-dependent flavin-containing monooxygenase [Fulvivirga aurantia]MTI20745.1 NAD(P)/FAD-dependent oxidoreductase [Fulvivirga aurantia]
MTSEKTYDVVVIGGGQSGLACGYFLRRSKLNYVILDEQETPGGAWLHTWDSLKLFSPAEHSSLPGWMMPKAKEEYPSKDHVIQYLTDYEKRYKLPIHRPVKVERVSKSDKGFEITTNQGTYNTKALISATGTWKKPYVPEIKDFERFEGQSLHSSAYSSPDQINGHEVLVVGGGNSGAQILAELSKTHATTWVTLKEPKLLPDEVDGRYLFEFATKQYKAKLEGKKIEPAGSLGDVVMVESVKDARDRDVLHSKRPFEAFYEDGVVWADGTKQKFDSVIWCTGFKASLDHLSGLFNGTKPAKIKTNLTSAQEIDGLWLVGYGSWTGYASATLIGVGRTARQTAKEVESYIKGE